MKESTNRTLITNPKNIICIGLNYADHIEETSLATHDFPEIFMKTSNALASNQDTVLIQDENLIMITKESSSSLLVKRVKIYLATKLKNIS